MPTSSGPNRKSVKMQMDISQWTVLFRLKQRQNTGKYFLYLSGIFTPESSDRYIFHQQIHKYFMRLAVIKGHPALEDVL